MANQKLFELQICLLGANTAPFLDTACNPFAPTRGRNARIIGELTPAFHKLSAGLFTDATEAILIHIIAPACNYYHTLMCELLKNRL